jgi:hypothetical protein
MSTPVQFDSMAEVWQERYRDVRGRGVVVTDVRQSDDFIHKRGESNTVFETLRPLGESFLSLVKGLLPGVTGPERTARGVLCFFPKFMGVRSITDLPGQTAERVGHVIDETYSLGLASHLILFNHSRRHGIPKLNTILLYQKFLVFAGAADAQMRQYNRNRYSMPGDIFQVQFTGHVEPLMKAEFSIGFLKMGKIRLHFRNLFFAGILLGLIADTEVSECR